MPRQITQGEHEQLEALIDACGLEHVLDAIGHVCFDKGEHIRTSWQDNATGALWDTAGKAVGAASRRMSVRRVSEGK